MYNEQIKQLINENRSLFWYTPEDQKESISPDLLVETILNYGTLDTVRQLFSAMGIDEVAKVFFRAKGRQKLNYYPEIYHFFTLYFNSHVQKNIE